MSFVRRHVVALTAVLIALAVGMALGGGPLAGTGASRLVASSTSDSRDGERGGATANLGERLAANGATRLYAQGLSDRSVALVALPGVQAKVMSALSDEVATAGGEVTATYVAEPALVDPGQKTLIDGLGDQLVDQLENIKISGDSVPYDRMGQLIGLSISGLPGGSANAKLPAESITVADSLVKADLLTIEGDASARADYVIVLLGDDTGAGDDLIYSGLIVGLAQQSDAVVVVGSTIDAVNGRLGRLREDRWGLSEVATVDGVETEAGQITAVLALTEWPASQGGSFGASGADGPVPLR
jgi:hypothetical protein